jgi:NADH-quinone oxidoreductase subunit N
VNLGVLLTDLVGDTLNVSLPAFRPEACLAVTVVLLLLCRMLPGARLLHSSWVAFGGVLFAAAYAWADLRSLPGSPWQPVAGGAFREELFGGLLVVDGFTAYVRLILTGFLVLYIPFTKLSGIPGREEETDFHVLLLGAVLGMCLMASANHLLMVFMAVEMASVPSYALAGFLKGRKAASEAALKYAVYGAGAAGIMLYGISLLGGVLGSLHLPTMATKLSALLAAGSPGGVTTALMLGGLMLAVGLAFKLSAVPFHFWCPDVFEGAAAEVGAFLSVASKAAAVALAIRLGCGLTAPSGSDATVLAGLADARSYAAHVIGLLAVLTCTLGNLGAYGQTNMKRMLAYSTIAHAGYLMIGVAAAIALGGAGIAGAAGAGAAQDAVAAVAFYLGVYLFMNLAAFAIVALLRNVLRSEEIAAYAGLIQSSPGIVVAMGIVLVSLIGLPPLAGFTAKFLVFASAAQAITLGAEKPLMIVLLAVGGLNTVFSLVYYLRVLALMIFSPPPADRVAEPLPLVSFPGALVTGLVAPVVVFGVFFAGLYACARFAGGFAS